MATTRLWRFVTFMLLIFALTVPMTVMAQDTIPDVPDPASPTSSSIIDGFLAMSNTTLYLALVAMVLSFVYTIVMRQDVSDDIKAGVFAAICLVAGAIYTYIDQDSWNSNDWIRRALTMWAVGTVFYILMKTPLRTLSVRADNRLGRA